MTVNVGTSTITGVSAGNYDPKVFTADNFANGTIQAAKFASNTKGCVVKATYFQDATFNISDGSGTGGSVSIIQFNFSRASNSNDIMVLGWAPCEQGNSNLIGPFIECNSTRYYLSVNYMCPEGSDGRYGMMNIAASFSAAELGSGTFHTMTLGRQSKDGSAQSGPNYWNPQNNSSRSREQTTNLLLLEVSNIIGRFS